MQKKSTLLPIAVLFTLLLSTVAAAQTATLVPASHDFDFQFGDWKTHIKRLLHPLTGSQQWVEYDGTSIVSPIWNGAANTVELDVTGPAGHIQGISLRLYNPASRQWSLNYASTADGTMGVPTVGEFTNGRGEFYDMEPVGGRMVLVRNVITHPAPDSARFEQAYSTDGGKSWELNWIADDTRQASIPPQTTIRAPVPGQHDFDFEAGSWNIHLRRLKNRLAGSHEWVEFDGTSVTRPVLGGRGQLEQFETQDPASHARIEGLTLRLFNPDTREWRLYWANSSVGNLDPPQIGRVTNGVGDFYAMDTWKGQQVLVRFHWTKMDTPVPHFEQSYSTDGGTTWEANWITDQRRRS